MTPPPLFFHALLRPVILQILRATGYAAARPRDVDALTDMAARYLSRLCLLTAQHAQHNGVDTGRTTPTVVDVRMAMQDMGALLPERTLQEQEFFGEEDMRGVDAFIRWVKGPQNKEIKRVALDGNYEAKDYLEALIKKHSKSDDSKYTGTLLGRPIEHGEVAVEGGEYSSIRFWEEQRKRAAQRPPTEEPQQEPSPAPSSALSSVEDVDLVEIGIV